MASLQDQLITFLLGMPDLFKQKINAWIRQEIVDDDPCDVDSLFTQEVQQPSSKTKIHSENKNSD